jgi:hypothetical protein
MDLDFGFVGTSGRLEGIRCSETAATKVWRTASVTLRTAVSDRMMAECRQEKTSMNQNLRLGVKIFTPPISTNHGETINSRENGVYMALCGALSSNLQTSSDQTTSNG